MSQQEHSDVALKSPVQCGGARKTGQWGSSATWFSRNMSNRNMSSTHQGTRHGTPSLCLSWVSCCSPKMRSHDLLHLRLCLRVGLKASPSPLLCTFPPSFSAFRSHSQRLERSWSVRKQRKPRKPQPQPVGIRNPPKAKSLGIQRLPSDRQTWDPPVASTISTNCFCQSIQKDIYLHSTSLNHVLIHSRNRLTLNLQILFVPFTRASPLFRASHFVVSPLPGLCGSDDVCQPKPQPKRLQYGINEYHLRGTKQTKANNYAHEGMQET